MEKPSSSDTIRLARFREERPRASRLLRRGACLPNPLPRDDSRRLVTQSSSLIGACVHGERQSLAARVWARRSASSASSAAFARRAEFGRPRFLVSEVYAVLHRSDCTDEKSRNRLDAIVAAERGGTLADRLITVLDSTLGPMVVDGNKRASAIYGSSAPNLSLPIFLLTSASGDPLPPPP